jgi:signal transduction histidine kinase
VVQDNGPGLSQPERAAVRDRFYRCERDRLTPGSGLGLSIVDELAKAYGGSVQLGQSVLGGLKVELRLPEAEA